MAITRNDYYTNIIELEEKELKIFPKAVPLVKVVNSDRSKVKEFIITVNEENNNIVEFINIDSYESRRIILGTKKPIQNVIYCMLFDRDKSNLSVRLNQMSQQYTDVACYDMVLSKVISSCVYSKFQFKSRSSALKSNKKNPIEVRIDSEMFDALLSINEIDESSLSSLLDKNSKVTALVGYDSIVCKHSKELQKLEQMRDCGIVEKTNLISLYDAMPLDSRSNDQDINELMKLADFDPDDLDEIMTPKEIEEVGLHVAYNELTRIPQYFKQIALALVGEDEDTDELCTVQQVELVADEFTEKYVRKGVSFELAKAMLRREDKADENERNVRNNLPVSEDPLDRLSLKEEAAAIKEIYELRKDVL